MSFCYVRPTTSATFVTLAEMRINEVEMNLLQLRRHYIKYQVRRFRIIASFLFCFIHSREILDVHILRF